MKEDSHGGRQNGSRRKIILTHQKKNYFPLIKFRQQYFQKIDKLKTTKLQSERAFQQQKYREKLET